LTLLGLLEAITVAVDLDKLGAMDEAIDKGDGASSVWEDLGPVIEGLQSKSARGLKEPMRESRNRLA